MKRESWEAMALVNRQRAAVYVLCQIVGWGTYVSAGFLLFSVSDKDVLLHWTRYGGMFGSSAVVGILTTHWYRFYIKRRGWLLLTPGRLLPRVSAATLALTVLLAAQISVLWWLFGIGSYRSLDWVIPALISWFWPAFLWHILYFGAHYFERYRQAELERLQLAVAAKEAQLQRLVAQINPHFMFNCLNSLRALITEDPVRAKNMVTELAELLRYSLQSGKALTVPLRTELEIVNTYLRLEAMRFEERLAIQIEAAAETFCVPVPTMLLQSLVENGVRHGIERLPHGGQIRVSSQLKNGSLQIQVINSGQLGNSGNSTGMGLANARERLRILYGNAAALVVENQGADSVRAEMHIPLSREPP